jgi:hypothetical protein
MRTKPRAATVSLDVYEDIERCMSGGWSNGLPVIPPYGSLVDQMLAALAWDYTEVVGSLPEQSIEVHASHVAAAAVMTGCKSEYGPVLRALTLALLDPAFNITGVEVTTGGASATVIVSGPAVERYGFAHEANCLGANNRANATVGRFAQMVRYFCGRGGGALQSHGTMGHPGRLSFCIAEHPETVWAPFHTQFGLPAAASAVTPSYQPRDRRASTTTTPGPARRSLRRSRAASSATRSPRAPCGC